MAAFHNVGQDENVNVLNVASPVNTHDVICNTGVLKALPLILKERILSSTRSGPLVVYSEYSNGAASSSCSQVSISSASGLNEPHNFRYARVRVQPDGKQQCDNDIDDAFLDEIMQFRNTSSDSEEEIREYTEEMREYTPPQLSRPLAEFRQLKRENCRKMPTIFEVETVFSDDTSYYCLSKCQTESPVYQSLIDVEEMCFKKSRHRDSVEVAVVDISILGGKKLGVLLMHE
jgi:hypothetical protein